jgi:hypothetical protein
MSTEVIKVHVCKDDDAGVYYATSDDIGLAVESDSLDALMLEIDSALPELLQVKEMKHGMVK